MTWTHNLKSANRIIPTHFGKPLLPQVNPLQSNRIPSSLISISRIYCIREVKESAMSFGWGTGTALPPGTMGGQSSPRHINLQIYIQSCIYKLKKPFPFELSVVNYNFHPLQTYSLWCVLVCVCLVSHARPLPPQRLS